MNFVDIIHYIQIVVIILTILLAFIYSLPIIFIDRFRNFINIFTLNLCLATIACNLYWLIHYLLLNFSPEFIYIETVCFILIYFEIMCTLQVPLAFLAVSIHRLCAIVYHTTPFFRRKRWIVLCMTVQWISGILLSIPTIPFHTRTCVIPLWLKIYILFNIVIIPIFIALILHLIIYKHVRSSTRRVIPSIQTTGNNSSNSRWIPTFSRRDRQLLRRMIIMFTIFIVGWTPLYLSDIILSDQFSFTLQITACFTLLAKSSLFVDVINLYRHNPQMRKFLRNIFFKCSLNQQDF